MNLASLFLNLLLLSASFQYTKGFTIPSIKVTTQKLNPKFRTRQSHFSLFSIDALDYSASFISQYGSENANILSTMPSLDIAAVSASAKAAIEATAVSNIGHDIFTFLIATVAIVPLSRALNISPVLGFLAVGCAIGPYGLHLFSNNEADIELGDFGILFLLFTEGLSLSPERIKDLRAFSKLGLAQLIFSIIVFFAGTLIGGPYILKYVEQLGIPLDDSMLRPILSSPAQAFTIAAAGALSSSAFVLPVLKEKEWEDRPEGIAGLSVLLLQDLAVAPLLVILPLIAGSGPQTATELGILISKATLGFAAVLVAGSYVLRYVFDIVANTRSTETFVAAALLVALGMGQTADFLGLSASTGAFAAGVLLAGNKYRAQIQADIKPFEGILLGVFFLTAGATLDPMVVLKEWPTLFTGIAAFVVTKAGIIFAQGPILGLRPGEAARVGLTLAGGGEFSFVLFKLAQDVEILPNSLAKLLTASVIISMSLTPLLGELGDFAGNYIDQRMGETPANNFDDFTSTQIENLFEEIDSDGSGSIELEELRVHLLDKGFQYASIAEIFTTFDTNNDGIISREEWKEGLKAGFLTNAYVNKMNEEEVQTSFASDAIVICGFGEMGKSVYRVLQANGGLDGEVVAVDLNPSRVAAGVLNGEPVIFGDGAKFDLFQAAGIPTPRAVVITYASDSRRIDATSRLYESLPKGTPIYVKGGCNRVNNELLEAGATDVINETTEAALRFGSLLGVSNTMDEMNWLRKNAPLRSKDEKEAVPGYSEASLSKLAEEVGCTRADISRLFDLFSTLDRTGNGDVPISDLKDIVMLNVSDGPIDEKTLTSCMESADEDGDGDLTFDEFVRVSCRPQL